MSERVQTPETVPVAVELLRRACRALDQDACAAKREIRKALELLLDSVIQVPSGHVAGLAPWQARKVIDHVMTNIEMPIRVVDLANVVKLSASHFSRAFRRSFHTSPHAYIVALRVARARALMLESDECMSRIAVACGFADQAHFSRAFHRRVGCAPGLWRRARRGQPIETSASGARSAGSTVVPNHSGPAGFPRAMAAQGAAA